jgi:hypothetical protein
MDASDVIQRSLVDFATRLSPCLVAEFRSLIQTIQGEWARNEAIRHTVRLRPGSREPDGHGAL